MDPRQQAAIQKMLVGASPEYIAYLQQQGYPVSMPLIEEPAPVVTAPVIAPQVAVPAPSFAPVAPPLVPANAFRPQLNPIQRELARYFGG